MSIRQKALLIIHGIGEQKEFETLNEFTDGFFQAIRRKIQASMITNQQVSVTNEFNFGSRGKRDDGVVLEDLGFARVRLKEHHIDLYEGYWAKLALKPRFREIIAWLFSVLISNLVRIRPFTSIVGIFLMGLLLLIYMVPFLPLFPLIKFNEIFRMLICLIIFSLVVWIRNTIYIHIKRRRFQSHSNWLNFIGGYVGDIGDYTITLILVYPLLFYLFLQLGQYGKMCLIILGSVVISNILMFIFGKIRRNRKIKLGIDIILDILSYLPYLLPFLILVERCSGYCKVTISIVFILVSIIRKFASSFIFNYAGDVVIYTDDEFKKDKEKINKKIKERLIKMLNKYDEVYVIGHSLGSVIGYDVLYDVLVKNLIPDKEKIKVYFISVGSPLDKIAYLFRKKQKIKGKKAPGLDGIMWYNFHELSDFIGAKLNLYNHQIENILSKKFWYNPLSSHTGYWQVPKVMNKIIDIMEI